MGSTVNRRTNRPSRLLFPSLLLGSSLLILACEPEQPEPSDLPRSESAQQGEPTQTGQSLYVTSTKLWSRSGAITEIPVCFENPDPSNDTERGLVRTSVEETWQSVASVRFTGWGPCSATAKGIRLRIQDVGPYTLGLGTDLDGVKDGMSLNFTFSTWSTGCQMTKPYCIRVGAVHEFGHAYVADRLGDPLPRQQGRVTLNPLAHIDLVGTVLLPALMALGVGVPLGWGKPVEWTGHPRYLTRRFHMRTIRLMVSVAGPAMNLLLALLVSVVLVVGVRLRLGGEGFFLVCQYLVRLNLGLMFFNLLPVPPDRKSVV